MNSLFNHPPDSAPDGAPAQPAETLSGMLERITFANPDNGYTVARFQTESHGLATAVGNLFGASVGEALRLTGRWTNSPKFGRQFTIDSFVPTLPSTAPAIQKYLASGLIKGIGKKYAERIVAAFGAETLEVLDKAPERLSEVEGIARKRIADITEAWKRQTGIRDIVLCLQRYGISASWAVRLFKVYGGGAVGIIRADPFRLALEIHGIGFASADKIAEAAGIAKDDPRRIQAAVKHRLSEYAHDGHAFAPYDLLEAEVAQMVGVEAAVVRDAISVLHKDKSVVAELLPEGDKAVYDSPLHNAETRVAQAVRAIATTAKHLPRIAADREIDEFEVRFNFQFAERQRQALRQAIDHGALILTGGPGTGKTTTLRGIIEILDAHGVSIALAAPTGRAAKRLSETTGREASTIHRLLKWNPQKGRFQHNEELPLPHNCVVIDEFSMVDISLAHQLFRAIKPDTAVILVGDTDQLPSVGPGNVLSDLIASKVLPVVRLDEIFRQAAQSLIVVNAHRVNKGKMPLTTPKPEEFANPDFFFIPKTDPAEVLEALKEVISGRIPRKYGFDPRDDIQVITPMRRGDLGVSNLNEALQGLLNPTGPLLTRGRAAFKTGDKVMQVRNNYDRDVFNGDIGRILEIDDKAEIVRVGFDGRSVPYPFDDLDELSLAYAVTVHKSQGSEYPAVVIPIHTQHYILLQRNLLYTAITRGKKLVVLIGSHRALALAVKNDKISQRFSGLRQRLKVVT